jgi:hypothetical protein
VKAIVSQLILNIEDNEYSRSQADGQAGYIDGAECLIPADVPDGYPDKVSPHVVTSLKLL